MVTETTTGPEGRPVTVKHSVGGGALSAGDTATAGVTAGEVTAVAFEDAYQEEQPEAGSHCHQ